MYTFRCLAETIHPQINGEYRKLLILKMELGSI